MNDVRIQVRLERLEVGPSPASEELVLQMPEDLRGRAVVDAVALPRHALHHAGPLEPPRPRRVPALPAHVAVEYRFGPLGYLRQQPVEQGGPLGHVRAGGRGPRDYPLTAEVVDRREVGLAPGLLELRDVGAHLPPRAVGREVAADDVLEDLADDALVGVVAVAVGLPAYPAPDAHLAHHLLSTVLSAMTAPSSPRRHMAIWRWPQPLAVREKISATASRSPGLVGRPGCESA